MRAGNRQLKDKTSRENFKQKEHFRTTTMAIERERYQKATAGNHARKELALNLQTGEHRYQKSSRIKDLQGQISGWMLAGVTFKRFNSQNSTDIGESEQIPAKHNWQSPKYASWLIEAPAGVSKHLSIQVSLQLSCLARSWRHVIFTSISSLPCYGSLIALIGPSFSAPLSYFGLQSFMKA